jgi:hypothetical protein
MTGYYSETQLRQAKRQIGVFAFPNGNAKVDGDPNKVEGDVEWLVKELIESVVKGQL